MDRDLPEGEDAEGRPVRLRALREGLLVRRRPRHALPRHRCARRGRRHREHLPRRLPRVRADAAAGRDHGRRAARGLASRDEGAADQGGRPRRARAVDARDRRFDQPLCRPVRHRLGHHERLHRPGLGAAGDPRHRGAGHRRGADRHRDRPGGRDPGRGRLQPLRRPGRSGSSCATTRSWKSSRPSCSGTPAAVRRPDEQGGARWRR
jgi:hypothetical protein